MNKNIAPSIDHVGREDDSAGWDEGRDRTRRSPNSLYYVDLSKCVWMEKWRVRLCMCLFRLWTLLCVCVHSYVCVSVCVFASETVIWANREL